MSVCKYFRSEDKACYAQRFTPTCPCGGDQEQRRKLCPVLRKEKKQELRRIITMVQEAKEDMALIEKRLEDILNYYELE